MGLFPLPNVTLLPCELLPLHVFEPRYRRLVEDLVADDGLIAVPRLRPGYEANYHGAPPVFEVCGAGQIVQYESLADGCYNVLIRGLMRIELLEEVTTEPYRVARARELGDLESSSLAAHESLRTEVAKLSRRLFGRLSGSERSLAEAAMVAARGSSCDGYLAGLFVRDPAERQALLEERDPTRRLVLLLELLQRRLSLDSASPHPDSRELN